MRFEFKTAYNQKTTTAMAKAVRKTVRKKSNMRSRICGVFLLVLVVLLSIPTGGERFQLDLRIGINWLVGLGVLAVLLFEDQINGYTARKRMLPGTAEAKTAFTEDGFWSETEAGKTQWNYDTIVLIAEIPDYFVFVYDRTHAQAYDKSSISGGTVEEFRNFISQKTGKSVQKL